MKLENYAVATGIPDICNYTVKPCPKCGRRILAYGKPCSVRTPKIIRWYRKTFRHGVTCVVCGNYAPSVRTWNRRADNGNG